MSRSMPLSAWSPDAKVLESFDTEMIDCMEMTRTDASFDYSYAMHML